MNATITRRRAGFSLIELLVVIGLLAALTAIGTGVYFRISAGATVKATEETVSKATSGFQQIWSAELDNARDSFAGKSGFAQYATQVENTKAIAGGDVDRARALWNYLWMKNAFPQTIAEATTATNLAVTGYTTVSLPARPTFAGMTAGSLSNPDQAATLLYRILTQKGSRGQTYNEEAIGSLSVVLPGTQYRVFTDAFGYPLTFVFSSTGIQNDVNGAEYQKGNNPSRDPFDPTGTLLPPPAPPATLPPPPRPVYWSNATARVAAATVLGRCINPGAMPPVYDFDNSNWQPTIVSRGASRIWDPTFLVPTLKTPTPYPANYFRFEPIPDGYLVGYKLRRQGARGDQ